MKIDNDYADEIRDLAGEKLQKRGFDINYKLTQEGEVLEQIIDIFFVNNL